MKNVVRVKISGLNLPRLLNKLVQNNILITGLVSRKKYIKFSIEEQDIPILDKICKQEHKFYVVIKKSGIKNMLSKLPYLLGTVMALVVTYVYLFSINCFIFKVNIRYSGESFYDISKVNKLLNDNGIEEGIRKKDVSVKSLQKLLMLNIDDIENCTVEINGGNLNILVYPATMKYEVNEKNLISNFDGVIISAEAFAGNLKVKAGDIVKKGDLLIENNQGAKGKIQAKVYFTGTKIYNEKQQEIIYTGNYFVDKSYSLLKKNLFKTSNKCNFSKYLVKNCGFYLMPNFFIPIYCREDIYYEIEINEKIVPFEEVEDSIKNEVYDIAAMQIPINSQKENVTYSVVKEENYTRVDCFIEVVLDLV